MLGKRVERVWGWDCHGLPIEQKVQKKLGLESNKEIDMDSRPVEIRLIFQRFYFLSSTGE
jgi:isoleucyl-tRNA synthetase